MRESDVETLAMAIFSRNPNWIPEDCFRRAEIFLELAESRRKAVPAPAQEKIKTRKLWDGYSEPFMKFWRNYPNPKGKGAAYTSWRKAARTVGGEEKLLALVRQPILEARASESWLQGFIPLASTWLNQRRWEDSEGAYTPSD